MYAIYIYGNIYHQYTPNVSIYTIHVWYGDGGFSSATFDYRRISQAQDTRYIMVYPRNWCGIWLACTYYIILLSIDIVAFFSQGCSQHSQVDCSCGACCRVKCFCCILWSTEPTMIVKNNNHRGFMGYIGYMTNIDPKKNRFLLYVPWSNYIGINEWGPWSSIHFLGRKSH